VPSDRHLRRVKLFYGVCRLWVTSMVESVTRTVLKGCERREKAKKIFAKIEAVLGGGEEQLEHLKGEPTREGWGCSSLRGPVCE